MARGTAQPGHDATSSSPTLPPHTDSRPPVPSCAGVSTPHLPGTSTFTVRSLTLTTALTLTLTPLPSFPPCYHYPHSHHYPYFLAVTTAPL
ncbi:hypothetical protein Pmani_005313 [Petrolisthes manimaculis]|uniref:Uncharacterized protein n=1 Tax=Petrolisthes manimaculis TaxID=1843537 RepID=A0AAE1QD56_9EUCA|nr:hypothetical protein Pmani_005313 [Petrolisthes manimaculis]